MGDEGEWAAGINGAVSLHDCLIAFDLSEPVAIEFTWHFHVLVVRMSENRPAVRVGQAGRSASRSFV